MMTTNSQDEVEASDPSYIDYELFLDPDFSAPKFANILVLGTNNPTDTPLDLTTPLSKVLFDIQEVDSHIHTLTSKSALPLLSHTQTQDAASSRITAELSSQIGSLNDSYKRLEKEIIGRYEVAEEVRQVSERLWHTVRLGRAVGRAFQLGRQLEVQMSELQGSSAGTKESTTATKAREDHRAMVRASYTVLALKALFEADQEGEEGEGLARVHAVATLRNDFVTPSERIIRNKSQQIVREFSMSTLSGSSTYAQTEDTKSRTTSALLTLYLLSSMSSSGKHATPKFSGDLMISALQDYLRTSITSSLASLARSLGSLPTLDRTLLEVSARCQNIVALSLILDSTKAPPHQLAAPTASTSTVATERSLLQPLLQSLETASLPSYFWRTIAGSLSNRVQELMNKGGVQARTLRSKKAEVRDALRECVVKGGQPPAGAGSAKGTAIASAAKDGWEREIAVMVGAVVGHLGR